MKRRIQFIFFIVKQFSNHTVYLLTVNYQVEDEHYV